MCVREASAAMSTADGSAYTDPIRPLRGEPPGGARLLPTLGDGGVRPTERPGPLRGQSPELADRSCARRRDRPTAGAVPGQGAAFLRPQGRLVGARIGFDSGVPQGRRRGRDGSQHRHVSRRVRSAQPGGCGGDIPGGDQSQRPFDRSVEDRSGTDGARSVRPDQRAVSHRASRPRVSAQGHLPLRGARHRRDRGLLVGPSSARRRRSGSGARAHGAHRRRAKGRHGEPRTVGRSTPSRNARSGSGRPSSRRTGTGWDASPASRLPSGC